MQLLMTLYDKNAVHTFMLSLVALVVLLGAYLIYNIVMNRKSQVLYNELSNMERFSNHSNKQTDHVMKQFVASAGSSSTEKVVQTSISFSQELCNIRNMAKNENVDLVYMIDSEDFMVPSMMIQPIIESVIHCRRHELDKEQSQEMKPILVASRSFSKGFIITIANQGVNLLSNNEGEGDLMNVSKEIELAKKRIQDIPCGEFLMTNNSAFGTTYTIILPNEYK